MNESKSQKIISQFKDTCAQVDVNAPQSISALIATVDPIAIELGRDEALRIRVGSDDNSLWIYLRKLWRDLVRAQLTFWDGDDSGDDENVTETEKQRSSQDLCACVARLTRNLVAGVPENQHRAIENEPEIRRLLHYYTSWASVQSKDAILVARVLAQTLSNLMTGNETIIAKLWDIYLNLPEDQSILLRLLASQDARTLLAVLNIIQNCVRRNKIRAQLLTKSKLGSRICIKLLDNMVDLYEAEEGSDGGRAFDTGYDIFSNLIEGGLVPELYKKLAVPDEIITPHQTVLLKLIDSYLQTAPSPRNHGVRTVYREIGPMLLSSFFTLSMYAQHAIRRSLGDNTPTSSETLESQQQIPSELDVMLPKVCEALVLVAQCIITIILDTESSATATTKQNGNVSTVVSVSDLKQYYIDGRSGNQGLVESLIELLRLLDLFLPRINFGKPVGNRDDSSAPPAIIGFSYVKRDLVRLLGVLGNDNSAVQDRVRVCGGIEVVMNLCVIDERNPYLREHAIFTLHILLKNNEENQAIVSEIQPLGQWDSEGVLRHTVGVRR